ncbi:MAG: hypothetical protein EXX96DRAFT_625896, partial [Benjaminiella poitrasii]
LNSIFSISFKHNKYIGISESTQKAMMRELEDKYDIEDFADLDDIEKFEVEKLRPIYKV